jgi:AhpD family alkylhydroperoxidase
MATGRAALYGHHAALPVLDIFATLVRHPSMYERMVPLAQYLAAGLLPARDRELAVLRTAHLCGCTYQWEHHRRIGLGAGLTATEIEAIAGADHQWSAQDDATLRLVDELHHSGTPTDSTWQTLTSRWTVPELLELVALVGEHHKVAFILNAAGTQLEDWLPTLPELPGLSHHSPQSPQ